ncbi:phage tail tape measure protein [Phyllobacterium calauticae]|uniref:hypothetical protein n=1 Tax=Phyllobacterium calauticae TaxID=2817027 RepID=UPI001CBD0E31|nr:hypothetical protein [Phyllobacterium calauticae]
MMAKTFLGQLVLRLQDEMSGKAKKAATDVTRSMKKIEDHARRLAGAQWGTNFQRQIEKMGASARELEIVRRSWDRMHKDMQSKNLGTAMRKSEIGAWKVATLSHLAQVRSGLRSTEKEAQRSAKAIKAAMSAVLRPAYVAAGGYTGAYMVNNLGREAVTASSERQREYFRQKMANIPEKEREQMFQRSSELSQQYPSVNITDIMEMARSARNTMGSTEQGMKILDGMVRAMVTLQSSKGVDAATDQLMRMLRGIDNLGKNSNGDIGVKNVLDIIDGVTKAAQIEGADLDPGKMFEFARRAKIAGPGLSTDFLMTTAPAFMQDMSAEGFGSALSSAYQAFVIGANSNSGKVNINEQRRLGLRKGEGNGDLVGSDLFGTNPYQWVKEYLMPALTKDGVDLNNETAVSKAVAKTTKNTNASGMLTRMITQSDQTERLINLYGRSMGTDAADQARFQDPFVAYKGFLESFKNLAAAVGESAMPVIVPGLNAISDAVNSFSAMVKAGDPTVATGLGVAGVGAAAFGTYKVGAAIYGLITAGTNLNVAALALQQAAAMQGGGAAGDLLVTGKGGGKKGILGMLAGGAGSILKSPIGKGGAWLAALYALQRGLDESPTKDPSMMDPEQLVRKHNAYRDRMNPSHAVSMPNYTPVPENKGFWEQMMAPVSSVGQPAGASSDQMDDILRRSADIGRQVVENLSVSAKPEVDGSGIKAALADARELKAVLAGLGSVITAAQDRINSEMRRSFSDYGVSP